MSVVDTLTENNVNDIFNEFYSLLTSTINIHALLKKLSRKQKRLINKPWITKGLLISIKKKQKMHKIHYIKGSPIDKLCYKTYSNVLTKVKNLAKNCTIIISSMNIVIIQKNLGRFAYSLTH